MAGPPAGKAAWRLGNHGRRLDGGRLRCNSAACSVTLWFAHVSHWLGMKFGFGSTAEKNGIPHIERVAPAAAIPGGEMKIPMRGFRLRVPARPVVGVCEAGGHVPLVREKRPVTRVSRGADSRVMS